MNPPQQIIKKSYHHSKSKNNGEPDETEMITHFRVNKNEPLPIESLSKELIYTIENCNVTLVIGETGCGKTTKIPEYLYHAGYKKIVHILQRRIAVVTIANRVAKNMGFQIGKEVGYSVRFDYNYEENTNIKFITEGMFIRELLLDPLLGRYSVVIMDDCHERTVSTEIIFGLLKKIFKKRPDLKIIISSATMDYDNYMKFFSRNENFETKLFFISGRNYPVDIYYLDNPCKDYIQAALETCQSIHRTSPKNSGDILVFLTGQEEINTFIERSESVGLRRNDILIYPLYAGLNVDRQLDVFTPTPHNKRKIIVSTNIAEASVTIDNIAYVIDSCFVKLKFNNPMTDSDSLFVIPASKFSLDQRAGRAGRVRAGKCYRLCTQSEYEKLYLMTNSEIQRTDLKEFILRLKSMGIKDLNKFETLTIPERNSIARSLESLFFLGILDDKTSLTEIGVKVSEIPIDPRLAVSIIKAGRQKFSCVEEVLIISSMLSVPNIFYQVKDPQTIMKSKQKVGVVEGDHLSLLELFKEYRRSKERSKLCKDLYINENAIKQAFEIYENIKLYLKKYKIDIRSSVDDDGEDILKSFLYGYFLNIAQKQPDGSYRSLRWNIPLHIHPSSVLYSILPDYVMYFDLVCTAKNFMKEVSKIEKEWILEIAGHYYEDRTKQVISERQYAEITKNEKLIQSEVSDKNSINNVVAMRAQEKYGGNNLSFSTKRNNNRIYMEVDKNKSDDYYFDDLDNHVIEPNQPKILKKSHINVESKALNENTLEKEDEELDNITLLRRMRNRVNK